MRRHCSLVEAILLLLAFAAAGSKAYLVHESFEENYEEPSRGKRQEAGVAVAGASSENHATPNARSNVAASRNLYYLEPKYYWDVRDKQKLYRQQLQKKKFEKLQNYHKQIHEMSKARYIEPSGPNSLFRSTIGRKTYYEPKRASKIYDVYELIDESSNSFTWPKWLGFGDFFTINRISSDDSKHLGNSYIVPRTRPTEPTTPVEETRAISQVATSATEEPTTTITITSA